MGLQTLVKLLLVSTGRGRGFGVGFNGSGSMTAGVSGIFPIIGIMNGGGGNGLSPTRAGTGKPLGAIEGTNAQHHWPFIFPTF